MSEIFAAQLGAVATLALAVLALITAIFAWLAFRKQAQEVRAIERQVADEQEVTSQQAELLTIQAGQLEVLRAQLDDQRKAGAAQGEVLELQAAELRESLEERKREAERMHRVQASRVFVTQKHSAGGDLVGIGVKPPSVTATAQNTSDQPVYDAEFYWRYGSASYRDPNPEPIGTLLPGAPYRSERAFPHGTNFDVSGAFLRFRDAAGTRWIRRADGYLGEQP